MKIGKIFLCLAIFGFLAVAASALAATTATASKTPTQLTISADSSIAAGQDLIIRGGLTNALTGSNISGARIDLNVINDNFNKMNTITDASTTDFLGDYLIATKVPTACVGTVRLQATFAGDTTYSQSVSSSTTLTVTKPWLGSVPDCAATDYSFLATAPSTATGSTVSTSKPGEYRPLVQIPGVNTADFLQYLSGMYNFLISIVGILAMASLVYGGFRYLTSVGNPAAVEDAKDIINSAIIGLVLALSSWLILNEINPDVLVLKKPGQIGGATDKYAYGQTSFAKCFTNVDDPGYGTQANPCRCVDGTEQYSTKTKTNLILSMSPTNPAPSAPAGSLTASGKLTDDKGNGLSGKTVKINRVNADLNASSTFTTTTTAPDGSFSYTTPVPCSDTATRQAIFDGDSTYTFAVSNPVTLTIGGTPACTADSYKNNSTNPPVASILPNSFCQNLCSDTSDFHCLLPKLGVGITAEDAKSGNQRIESPSPAKVNQPIYFDTVTNTKTGFPICKIEVNYTSSWWNWTGADYTCVPGPTCNPTSPDTPWYPRVDGNFIHKYTSATTAAPVLRVWVKNPNDGTCTIPKDDKNAIIEVK